jgi:phosphotransacetylase
VVAPTAKVHRPRTLLPEVHLHEHGARFKQLIEAAQKLEPLKTAVVHPCDAVSLAGAVEAMRQGLIVPVLVAPRHKIETAANHAKLALGDIEVVEKPHSHAAAARAAELAGKGKVQALMKGALHTDEVMGSVVNPDSGLGTERRHMFVVGAPHYPKPLLITDAAINIYPLAGRAGRRIVRSCLMPQLNNSGALPGDTWCVGYGVESILGAGQLTPRLVWAS